MRSWIGILTVFAALLIGAWPRVAVSQPVTQTCYAHPEMVTYLMTKHQEERYSQGLSQMGNMIEVFVSKSGSWTVVVTNTKKTSCMMDAGTNWHSKSKVQEEKL